MDEGFGPELEPWEREVRVGDARIVVAQPPGTDGYEVEVWWTGDDVECVELRATEQQLRALHAAIGGLLSR